MVDGKKIRELREQKNMTQEDLAKIIGIARTIIARYELGHMPPSISSLEKIAEYFEKPITYFLTG